VHITFPFTSIFLLQAMYLGEAFVDAKSKTHVVTENSTMLGGTMLGGIVLVWYRFYRSGSTPYKKISFMSQTLEQVTDHIRSFRS
jgi:hypothetical protein